MGQPSSPPPPPLPPSAPPWAALPPQNNIESWNFQRRAELKELSIPFAMAFMRDDVVTAGDDWDRERAQGKPTEVARKAVAYAAALQAALDLARPRL